MIRAFFGLIAIVFCGFVFAAFQSGVESSSIKELVKEKVQQAASEAIPELQLQVIVQQMKQMCPVRYGANCTLIDVNVGDDMQIEARYVLQTGGASVSKADQSKFRQMAIQQFQATGIGDQLIGQKISWKYRYETVSGSPLFEIVVGPDDFATSVRPQVASARPTQQLQSMMNSVLKSSRQPMADNNQPIQVVALDNVDDAFFSDGNVFGHNGSGSNFASSNERKLRKPTQVQSNPFAK